MCVHTQYADTSNYISSRLRQQRNVLCFSMAKEAGAASNFGFTCLLGRATKRLPLEGKLSLKATDEVSPKRICSYQSRKSAKFTRIIMCYLYSRTTLCNGDNPSVTFGDSSLCTREPVFVYSLNPYNPKFPAAGQRRHTQNAPFHDMFRKILQTFVDGVHIRCYTHSNRSKFLLLPFTKENKSNA